MVEKRTIWLILEPLMYNKEYLHLAELSRMLKMPHPTLRKYLQEFEKLGIITKQIKGRLTLYKLNQENKLILDYIQIIEKEKLIEKTQKNIIFKELVTFVHENSKDNKILIFGSAVENINKANDIDLLIIGKNIDKENIEKKLNKELHIINVKTFKEINNSLKKEIIKKHIIIEGMEDLTKWMNLN